MNDDQDLARIAAAEHLATLPRLVYRGPLHGPGTQLVLVFDCPTPDPDNHGYRFGALFIVVPEPPEEDILVYPAALTVDNERVVGRPYGDILGISDESGTDALRNARTVNR